MAQHLACIPGDRASYTHLTDEGKKPLQSLVSERWAGLLPGLTVLPELCQRKGHLVAQSLTILQEDQEGPRFWGRGPSSHSVRPTASS